MAPILEEMQNQLELFFHGLNWTYIMIFAFVVHGIRYKEEFEWYVEFFKKRKKLQPFKFWIAGLIVAFLFVVFTTLEGRIDIPYISSILRSWIVVIVFNSVFSQKISRLDH